MGTFNKLLLTVGVRRTEKAKYQDMCTNKYPSPYVFINKYIGTIGDFSAFISFMLLDCLHFYNTDEMYARPQTKWGEVLKQIDHGKCALSWPKL